VRCLGPCDKCAIYINRNHSSGAVLEREYH
jgi:hypothetical protein